MKIRQKYNFEKKIVGPPAESKIFFYDLKMKIRQK